MVGGGGGGEHGWHLGTGIIKYNGMAASVCSAGPCLFVRQKDKQLSRELANKTGFAPAAHTRFFLMCVEKKLPKRFFFLRGEP